ncbi:MAG: T9SS type A sorting domain-containing protein, partial [Planctomycetota bacterium]
FKAYNYLDTLELSIENIFNYLQTELVSIPNNAESLTFKVEIKASQPDTLSDGTLNTNKYTPFTNIIFRLLAKDSLSNTLLDNIGYKLLNNPSGLHNYSKEFTVNASVLRTQNIYLLPNIGVSGTLNNSNLYFTLVNVCIAENEVGKNSPENINNKIQPTEYVLQQNYPNPFNPATNIKYNLPQDSFVELKIFDVLGREITTLVNEKQESGNYSIQFDASNLPSGIYIYRIVSGKFTQTKKMILLK